MSQDNIILTISLGIPILMTIFSIVGRIWCYISDKNIDKSIAKNTDESLAKLRENLQHSRYGIAWTDSNTTIEQVSPPKEYCQCDYCGTFYNGFVSNCKNCGAQIKMPSEFYKRDYIVKMNYIKR